MDLVTLKSQIKRNELLNFYIFTGDEIALQNIYINQMSKDVRRVETVAEIYTSLTSRLLQDNSNVVYVVRDDKEFMGREKAYTDISKRIKNGTLVICITEIDKRSKFYNMYKEDIIEFHHMTTEQLFPQVKKLVKGRDNILMYFIEKCNNDYSSIMNNIDKLNYMNVRELTKEIIDELIPKDEEVDIYSILDDFIKLDAKKVLHKLSILLKGDNELGFLTLLYNKINHCILVEGYRDSQHLSKDTGLNQYECINILDNNRIKPANLLYCLRLLNKYDSGIKNGRYEPKHAVWCCVVEMMTL